MENIENHCKFCGAPEGKCYCSVNVKLNCAYCGNEYPCKCKEREDERVWDRYGYIDIY